MRRKDLTQSKRHILPAQCTGGTYETEGFNTGQTWLRPRLLFLEPAGVVVQAFYRNYSTGYTGSKIIIEATKVSGRLSGDPGIVS